MLQNQALLLHSDLNVLEAHPENKIIPEGIEIGLQSRTSAIAKKFSQESIQDLKARAEETPMALWAIYAAMVFGLFLVFVLVSMNRQLQNLDSASTAMSHPIENTIKITRAHAAKIHKIEKSIQAMTSELSRIDTRLNKKK